MNFCIVVHHKITEDTIYDIKLNMSVLLFRVKQFDSFKESYEMGHIYTIRNYLYIGYSHDLNYGP